MNVKIEQVSSVKKKLSFEVPAEHVATAIDKAYKKIATTAKVKGFRPGKIPQAVLEQYYAPQMEKQVLNGLINDTYFKALVDHKIPAVSGPEIVESGVLAKGQAFTFHAEVEVKPEFEPKGYTGLKLQKEKFVAESKAVDERLREMAEGRAEMQPSSRKQVASGDFVTIDFEGFVNGVAFDGGKAEGHQLEIGSGSFIPGFEEQLIGKATGSDCEVNVTFPDSYGSKELAGQPALFKVRLHEIKEKVAPAIDDEFAKSFGLESLAELRSKLEEGYQSQELSRIDGDLRERLMTALIEKNPLDVPESMVADQLDFMVGNIRRRLEQQGMSLEMMGMNDEAFKGMYRETAVKQVQGSLILEAVAKTENIRVEESELDGKLAEIATMANAPLAAVKKYYAEADAKRGLISQVAEEKVIKYLLDQATVKEVAKDKLVDKKNIAEKE